jgi:polysaccharide biosynthesis protein PelD
MTDVDFSRFTSSRTSWLETTALSVAAMAALVWLGPSPYLAFAPLLAGARYGTYHGVACGLFLTVPLIVVSGAVAFPADAGFGIASLTWLMTGAISGVFRDTSKRQIRGLETTSTLLRMRLDDLGRAYHVLNVSHERLQNLLPEQPSSLREAIERLRDSAVDTGCEIPDAFAQRVLELLRDHVGVRAATWHALDEARRPGRLIASLGVEGDVQEDAIIRHAARLGDVLSVRDLDGFEPGSTLVAVPLVDVEGTVHGVVAVRELPFISLHDATLSLLAVLGGHVGDLLSVRRTLPIEGAAALQKSFCVGLSRAIVDARRHHVPSALLVLSLRAQAPLPPHAGDALRRIARKLAASRRATDLSHILLDVHGNPRVCLLLRLADEVGLARCQAKLATLALEEIAAAGIRCEVDTVCWRLDQVALPKRPAMLETFLLALARNGAAAPTLVHTQVRNTRNVALGRGHGQVS